MKKYKQDFIELLVKAQALKFGEFTLKSGRKAPYFLNVGSFYTGGLITELGRAYAQAFLDSGVQAEVIFGPAYKGIPLSVVTTSVLHSEFKKEISFAFNRKEIKDHGEGKLLVGAPLSEKTRVLLIDDVITAGTAIRETLELLKTNGNPRVVGVLIAMNRMEKNNEGKNALEEIEAASVKVFSIVNLDEVIEALHGRKVNGQVYIDDEMMVKIKAYRREFGIL
ncbi:orotate phosphoribosyltransferase [Candidatus Peregrinibacteria bacterium]|nr:orotate phosphoribosyltransferase [Candidatus Peregrinibacteria bacterium]